MATLESVVRLTISGQTLANGVPVSDMTISLDWKYKPVELLQAITDSAPKVKDLFEALLNSFAQPVTPQPAATVTESSVKGATDS